MYTQFEAFNAHKCFPCFDQPDIKANLTFYSVSPSDWKVVSCEPVEQEFGNSEEFDAQIQKIGCGREVYSLFEGPVKFFKFMKTEKISTYLYAFVVGPYEYVVYEGEDKNKYVPL